uniref:MAP kinase-activating death domain protein n=1 Tax=Steinernema glaseri TaxID=37863 RepID=A0A1I7Z584_9BILA
MDDKNKELCPRLIDYLVVVGRRKRTRNNSFSQASFDGEPTSTLLTQNTAGFVSKPELLRRYPTDDHKDFVLPTDVTVFCQPEGCISLGPQRRVQSIRDKVSFVFTLTEKDSAKIRYGVCVNFFQQCERHSNSEKNGAAAERHTRLKRKQPTCSLISLCVISHHPFLSIYRQLLELLHQLIDAANFRCNLDDTIPKDAVWQVLIGRWTDPIPEKVMIEIRQLETWILMLLSSPVPVPGKTKVQLDVMPEDIDMFQFEFALPDHTRFSLVDFPLHLPLELLGVDTAVQVLAAVMLEYKVVLQSRNYNAVSMCVLAIVALLYPLEYMFPVIPLLPAYMNSAEQLLLAPTPFLIGVPASFFLHRKIKKLPNDVILVDLDTNEVTFPDGMEIPALPEPDSSVLKQNFRNALGRTTSVALQNELGGQRGNLDASYIPDSDEIDVAARVAMIQFFNSPNVFANFSEHTRTLRLYPRPVVALQTESFLRSRPQTTQFIMDLCRTQAVEYFAECSLCPRNETYVRVQTGIVSAAQIGDKPKWFADSLMPLHYTTYPNDSTLADAYRFFNSNQHYRPSDSDDDDVNESDMGSSSSIDEMVFDSSQSECEQLLETSKPLGEVNYIYKEPLRLELPLSDSAQSIHSSASSGRSSPGSSVSASAFDSEADIAKMAANLVLKSDSKGDFSFDHSGEPLMQTDLNDNTPIQSRKGISNAKAMLSQPNSNSSTPTNKTPPFRAVGMKGLHTLTDSGEKMLGPNLMSAINGYAEKSHDMFSQMLTKTAPKAQALRDKTMRPLAAAAANRMDSGQKKMSSSANTANQQSKNQQVMREICDQVVAGNGVGMFAYSRMKRLMEDESLRELVCSKLNLGLDVKRREDENVQDVPLTPSQYKGYLKVLQACIQGLETSFNTPGSNGLASVFHVLEIAHTHYLSSGNGAITPVSGVNSQAGTPSASCHDFQSSKVVKLPATTFDTRQGTSSVAPEKLARRPSEPPSLPPPPLPPSIPPRHTGIELPKGVPPPPLPPRPPPPRQESIIENSRLKSERTFDSEHDSSSSVTSESTPKANGDVHSNAMHASADEPQKVEQAESSNGNKHAVEPSTSKEQVRNAQQTPSKPVLPRSLPVEKHSLAATTSPQEIPKHYLYQDLIMPHQNPLWQKMVFWENAFFDVVAQERDIVGMDQEPSEMIDRYSGLADCEKKRLELEEDRLLSTLLHNLTAYMVMCGTTQKAIQQKVRRLLGKAHIGLVYSKTINQLLDSLPAQQGNGIALKPLGSRLVQKYSFTVHVGSNINCPMMFMEVCDDAVVLRAVSGAVSERWWYERLVNMTYSPKTRVLCLWLRRNDVEQVVLHKFYTKRCRELYNCMKAAMERAAERGKVAVTGRNLCGDFTVHDTDSNLGCILTVRIDGIQLQYANKQHFIELSNIKKINTYGGNVVVLEEYNRKKKELIQRRFMSTMAPSIAWSLHRVFSVAATLKSESGNGGARNFLTSCVPVLRETGYPFESKIVIPVDGCDDEPLK